MIVSGFQWLALVRLEFAFAKVPPNCMQVAEHANAKT